MTKRRRHFRLRSGGRDEAERELREEIEAHIELRVEDQVARGVPEAAAREEAMRRFGDPDAAWEELRGSLRRRERRVRFLELGDGLRRSLVLTLRHARRAPGYAVLSVLMLALGVGMTTTAFTVTDRVLLRELPYVEPSRIVRLYSQAEDPSWRVSVSMENWMDWRAGNRTLEASALHRDGAVSVGSDSGARRASMVQVTGEFFRVMRPPLVMGRTFTEEEAQAGELVAVVAESFWRSRMGAVEELPAEVRLDGRLWDVIGVIPDEQAYPAGREIWLPMTHLVRGSGDSRNWINFGAVARLAPGVTIEQADADLDRIADGIRAAWPDGIYSFGVHVVPLRESIVGNAREDIEPLAAAALFILLIGCANVAGMSLARTLSRGQEVAVHVALGAGRARVVRQVVSEHLYLGLAGGAAGVLIAWAATRLLGARLADLLPRATDLGIDAPVMAFAVLASIVAGLLAGAIPAWKASGMSVHTVLQGSRGAIGSASRTRAGGILVAVEVAVAVALLSSGGLLIRSFRSLVSRDVGFRVENVVAAEATLNAPVYGGDEWEENRRRYWAQAMERALAIPGVRAVAVGNWVPTGGGGTGFIRVPGNDDPTAGAGYRAVSADYFDVLGIPLLMGRAFDERDRAGSQRVTVINKAMADRYWPGENPLGQTVYATSMESYYDAEPITVVGVVDNVRHFGFDDEPDAEMFTVYSQVPWMAGEMTLLAHAPGIDADETALRLQRPLAEVDPDIAVEVTTFERRTGDWVSERRFLTTTLSAFAALALALAALGIYGLLSFAVAQRTREMGIRTALGAQRMGIIGLMMSRAARLFLFGAAIGLALSVAMVRVIQSRLVDIAATDALTWAVTLIVLAAACGLAAFAPAWRAARTDPLVALRTN